MKPATLPSRAPRQVAALVLLACSLSSAALAQQGKVYWTEVSFGGRGLVRANLDGSCPEPLNFPSLSSFVVTVVPETRQLYVGDSTPGAKGIYRMNLNGTGITPVLSSLPGGSAIEDVAVDLAGGKLYYLQPGQADRIRRANLDGSFDEQIVHANDVAPVVTPVAMDLDVASGEMYWLDTSLPGIRRANLDGSNIQTVVVRSPGAFAGMKVDVAGGYVYWGEGNTIRRFRMDQMGVVETVAAPGGTTFFSHIALDLVHQKVYWTHNTFGPYAVFRTDMAGGGPVETAFSGLDGQGLGLAVLPGPQLQLDITPGTVTAGQPLTFQVRAGLPFSPHFLFATAVDGIPFVLPLLPGVLDASGAWSLAPLAPAGLAGHDVTFTDFALAKIGMVEASAPATVTFQ